MSICKALVKEISIYNIRSVPTKINHKKIATREKERERVDKCNHKYKSQSYFPYK